MIHNRRSAAFNIVICPPPHILRKAVRVSKILKKHGGRFVLNGEKYFPHVSIYMAEFPLKNLNAVEKLLKIVASHAEPIALCATVANQNKGGYVDIGYVADRELLKLQRAVVVRLNPLRKGLIKRIDREEWAGLPKEKRLNIQRYGYHSVGTLFRPHLTFTRLGQRQALEDVLPLIPRTNFSFIGKEVGLFFTGLDGTCRKLVRKFPLKNH